MTDTKKLFESFSYLNIVRFILYQFLSVVLLIYLGLHFKENPVLISILCCLLLFVTLLNSREQIIVYSDRFLIVNKTLLPQLSTKREYKYDEIAKITADLSLTETNHTVTELLPPAFAFISIWNTITVAYKNGNTVEQKSKIYRQEFSKAFEVMKGLCDIDITVLENKNKVNDL